MKFELGEGNFEIGKGIKKSLSKYLLNWRKPNGACPRIEEFRRGGMGIWLRNRRTSAKATRWDPVLWEKKKKKRKRLWKLEGDSCPTIQNTAYFYFYFSCFNLNTVFVIIPISITALTPLLSIITLIGRCRNQEYVFGIME